MKPRRGPGLITVLLVLQALLGCGSDNVRFTPVSPLTSDWNFTGNRSLKQYPLLNATLIVNGNQVTAEGQVEVACSNQAGSAVGSNFDLSGPIASDGTFQLTESAANVSSIQVAIGGSVPAAGQSSWKGTYSIKDLPGYTSCIVNLAAPLAATAFAPLNSTMYVGTLSSQYGNLNVSTTLTQGAVVTFTQRSGNQIQYLSLAGTISISGSCIANGASTTDALNQIDGDTPSLFFKLNDGSSLNIIGHYGSPDESTLQEVLVALHGGSCDGKVFSGTLTRQ